MSSVSWQILPDLVVRHAGFPLNLLEMLRLPAVAAALDRLADLEEALESLRTNLLAGPFPEAVSATARGDPMRRILSKLRSRVGRNSDLAGLRDTRRTLSIEFGQGELGRGLDEIAALAETVASVEAEVRTLYGQERVNVTAALRRLYAEDPWLEEAIRVSNPDFHDSAFQSFTRGAINVRRAQERRFATYLHRFCAKNDTASFFGPMGYGSLFDTAIDDATTAKAPGKHNGRKVYLAFWAVQELARLIAANPRLRPHLIVRVHPLLHIDGERAVLGGKELPLPAEARHLLQRACTSVTCVSEAATTPLEMRLFDRLVARKLATLEIPIPSTVLDPLAYLRRFVTNALGPAAHEVLLIVDRIEDALAGMAAGTFAMRVAAAVRLEQAVGEIGLPTRRSAGATYADRTLSYEECDGGANILRLSPAASKRVLTRLQPVLDLMGAYGLRRARDVRATCVSAFRLLADGRSAIPYVEFIDGLHRLDTDGRLEKSGRAAEFQEKLENLAAMRVCDGAVRMDVSDVAALVGEDDGCGLYTSPDLLFAARDLRAIAEGEATLVLGETHQFVACWGSQMMFHPRAEDARQRTVAMLEGIGIGTRLATILHTRVHKGLVHESFPGTFVEVSGDAGPGARRIALRDLNVAMLGGTLSIVDRTSGTAFALYHSGDDKAHIWAFAPPRVSPAPIRLGTFTPRIHVGDVVYQRARWELDETTIATLDARHDELTAMRDLRRIARERGMPKRTFVRVPSEKKPLFLDLDSPNACAVVHELLRANGRGSCSEMLPDSDGLWLRDGQDDGYCIELRTTCFRPGPATYLPEDEHG
ncbi:hypothetical protein B5P46_01625 [Rhizobium leguminosarum]|uniref:Lantibiotic dehydratase N-terminal domain-containing protein n=1 Tax=Rhizobium leguminosarum TaxID=384 RepID=A0A4Q1UCN0_RHILE|nr:lantibiotic dehydratase [Rhizobium leguminosarum]RXT29799.1 hypothetical protein B5P46_01625 [Rhizobium leguminosarum]